MRVRIAYYDNLKFALIILVVVGHGIQFVDCNLNKALMTAIYVFHMPLFVFLTGYLFNERENVTKKMIGYIAMGYASKFLLFVVKAFLFGDMVLNLRVEIYHPWYMFSVAGYMLIMNWTKDISKMYILIATVVFALFAGFDSTVNNFWVVRMIAIFPFFVLGNLCRGKNIEYVMKTKLSKYRIFCTVMIGSWFIVCLLFRDWISENWLGVATFLNSYAYQNWYDVFIRMIWYPFAMVLSIAFMCIIPYNRVPLVSEWGTRTLSVYFWHYPILFIISKLLDLNEVFITLEGKLIWILVNVLITIILSFKVLKYIPEKIFNCKMCH